jgi:predicted small metal-binding protein
VQEQKNAVYPYQQEVLQKAAEHAQEHGIRQVTPELMERVKANIRDE